MKSIITTRRICNGIPFGKLERKVDNMMMNFWVNWDDCEFMTENAMREYVIKLGMEIEPVVREENDFGRYVNENYEPMEILTKGLTEDVLKLVYEYHLSRLIEQRAKEVVADEGWEYVSLSD